MGASAGSAELSLPNGESWRLSVRGPASLTFEESLFFSDGSGPKRGLQVVLRGRCLDRIEVHWRLELTGAAASRERAEPPAADATGSKVSTDEQK